MDEMQPADGERAGRLVRAVLEGEPEAFDRWFRAEHPAVWRLALGFLADSAEAEDLAQDAMLKLHDKLEDWDPRRSWAGFRNTLVLNLCRDRLRRVDARRRAEERAGEQRLPATLSDPAELAASGELRGVIEAALGRLPEREREAFVLRELEGLETSEVARLLAIGESSVRSLLTLARRRLRDLLGERLVGFAASEGGGSDA